MTRRSRLAAASLLACCCLARPALAAGASTGPSTGPSAGDFAQDAAAIERLVDENYAYLERLPGNALPLTDTLRAEAAAVSDERSLRRYAERALFMLADHHAITGRALSDSWAIVPSYSDLWIEFRGGVYVIDAVRDDSPAWRRGIRAGDVLAQVDGVPTDMAVERFWADLGARTQAADKAFAARILAAGRRDRDRRLTILASHGERRVVGLPNLYSSPARPPEALTSAATPAGLRIRFNDSLGDDAAIAAFDAALAGASPGQRTIIDLRDTPSGGNTVVARAILGWFVSEARAYQVHNLPREMRQTGIARQWVEEVLPRGNGRHHAGAVVVCVGRWTGSMGEGLAVAFGSLGAQVIGDPMAGLLGAVDDYELPHSGLAIKLPTERLFAVDGTPRERFRPSPGAANHESVEALCPAPRLEPR